MTISTTKKRAEAVAQANANAALEGFEPDAQDVEMQALYIDGGISLDEMLEEIRAQAAAAGGEEKP